MDEQALEQGVDDAARAEGAHHGVLLQPLDEIRTAADDAALGPPQQLVAGVADQIRPRLEVLAHRGLVRRELLGGEA
ncbi:hypothetical protein D3C80_809860 [compost metagenome]